MFARVDPSNLKERIDLIFMKGWKVVTLIAPGFSVNEVSPSATMDEISWFHYVEGRMIWTRYLVHCNGRVIQLAVAASLKNMYLKSVVGSELILISDIQDG